jgi:hypothetical protein
MIMNDLNAPNAHAFDGFVFDCYQQLPLAASFFFGVKKVYLQNIKNEITLTNHPIYSEVII